MSGKVFPRDDSSNPSLSTENGFGNFSSAASEGPKDDFGKKTLNVLLRTLCTIAPPSLFLSITLLFTPAVDAWKYKAVGCVVLAWSIPIGVRMFAARRIEVCGLYRGAFVVSATEHAIVLCLAALVLDGGLTLYACLVASLLYWMMAGIVVARRPACPKGIDLSLVTHGFLMLAFLVTVIMWTWQFQYF